MSMFTESKLFWIGRMMMAAPELEVPLIELESAYLLVQSDNPTNINRGMTLAIDTIRTLRPLVLAAIKNGNRNLNHAWTMFHEEMMA